MLFWGDSRRNAFAVLVCSILICFLDLRLMFVCMPLRPVCPVVGLVNTHRDFPADTNPVVEEIEILYFSKSTNVVLWKYSTTSKSPAFKPRLNCE